MKNISFSPPDITRREIQEVIKTLKSGWITTGPQTKTFEKEVASYCRATGAVCLNSATAGLELVLRLFEIGPGDEVITTPYTFAATANVIVHTGAKPIFVDVKEGEFNIDPGNIARAITKKTKAVIPVDFAGWPCDYSGIKRSLQQKCGLYSPRKNSLQENIRRPLLLADAAHSFGAYYKGTRTGTLADFSVFSFHAVKNLTTAEGGAVVFNSLPGLTLETIYRQLTLLSLHGQSKDALAKFKAGGWQYTIELPGYKCNMTDLGAAIGRVQLKRYDTEILPYRKKIIDTYTREFRGDDRFIIPQFKTGGTESSYHLFPLRIRGFKEKMRAELIQTMAEKGIALNVHFIPVVMHPYYQKLGYTIKKFPNTYRMFENEVSLPVHAKLSTSDARFICREIKKLVRG
jgi:dTDP-4-amino-4,6-dideoxygalactose transaminase